jgi:hypothetical protein
MGDVDAAATRVLGGRYLDRERLDALLRQAWLAADRRVGP